ncbi:MAG: hypothetical protein A2X29_01015 [Elusimicrobia bacterium GWA2_64_40]|nr:MAG: hypothetical protein A2X29_01015 [Elusimicrobia bacterium GWA2_64_40]OGR66788.1 MAG: hypothetical protein A2X30_11925 [Elusimicrobia bacterium GWB2_63_16]HAN04001.1 hypothetical protein [Elusimicrobiota bacterium]
MRKNISAAIAVFLLAACGGKEASAPPPAPAQAVQGALAPAGDRIGLPDGGWFTWGFAEKPKLGTAIMKVQVYDKAGTRATPYEVIGEYGMPSMRYHDSGPVKFQLNRKGDYLLPVNIVMAGEWEVLIRLIEGKEKIYEGKVLFTI